MSTLVAIAAEMTEKNIVKRSPAKQYDFLSTSFSGQGNNSKQ